MTSCTRAGSQAQFVICLLMTAVVDGSTQRMLQNGKQDIVTWNQMYKYLATNMMILRVSKVLSMLCIQSLIKGALLWQSVHLNSPKSKQAMRNCSLLQWRYVLFEQLQFTAVVAALNIVWMWPKMFPVGQQQRKQDLFYGLWSFCQSLARSHLSLPLFWFLCFTLHLHLSLGCLWYPRHWHQPLLDAWVATCPSAQKLQPSCSW